MKQLFLFCLMLCFASSYAQESPPGKVLSLPDKLFTFIDKKSNSFSEKIDAQTDRYLRRLQRKEEKLKRKLAKRDSALAGQLFGNVKERYEKLRSHATPTDKYSDSYSPRLDSTATALRFVRENNLSSNPALQNTLYSLKEVQSKLNATEQVRKQLIERQKLLKEQFQQLGMIKELRSFRKEIYYYQRQIREYKELWENPAKLEARLLQAVLSLPQFKEFFARNSQLGSLFALPGSGRSLTSSLAGLQTRASVQQSIIERFGSGPDVASAMQANLQSAQAQLDQLKEKAAQYTSGSLGNKDDIDMPDGFKPNSQKTRSFAQRLEIGANIQTQKARYYFPVTTDLALSAGYKLNDKSTVGIGMAYKAGLGRGWNSLALSHQGVGVRSFIDYKLKATFYLTGGYEQNYLSQFRSFQELKDYSAWQASGLLGLAKKYKVTKKVKGEMKLLWDFLSYQQIPRTSALLFRVGYSLK